MQVSGCPDLAKSLERAEQAQQALASAGCKERADDLGRAISAARGMRLCVGVVGQAKRGKSTLINGLLGRPDDAVAPIGRFPTTNVISRFAYADSEEARVHFVSEPEGSPGQTIPLAEIRHYVCEDLNPQNRKGVKSVEVLAPFTGLEPNVVLTDTPGADNALSSVHDAVLLEFMPQADAVIFLVTAGEPLTESEMQLLRHVRQSDVSKLFFAVNKSDLLGPQELAEGLAHNRKMLASLGYGEAPVFCIAARAYHQTGCDEGTEQMLAAVREMIATERTAVIAERLVGLVERLAAQTRMELSAEIALLDKTDAEIRQEQDRLAQACQAMDEAMPSMERQFREAWAAAFDDLERSRAAARAQMQQEYEDLIQRTSNSDMPALSRTIHSDMAKRFDELVTPSLEQCLGRVDAAVKALQVSVRQAMAVSVDLPTPLGDEADAWRDAGSIAQAGLPAVAGAAVAGVMPSIVTGMILSQLSLNPLTWGSLLIAGTAGTVATVGAVVLTPALLGLGAWRMYSAWRYEAARKRNDLALAVAGQIRSQFTAIAEQCTRIRACDGDIIDRFREAFSGKLAEYDDKLNSLATRRVTAGYVESLRRQTAALEAVLAAKG